MKKRYLKDKNKKKSLAQKRLELKKFASGLEVIDIPMGHDYRDFKALEDGEYFVHNEYNIHHEEADELVIARKENNKEATLYWMCEEKHVNNLYDILKRG